MGVAGRRANMIHSLLRGKRFPCHDLEDHNVLRTSIEAGVSYSPPIHMMVKVKLIIGAWIKIDR